MKRQSRDVFHRITEEAFRRLIQESTSIRQVFNKMGLCISGDQYKPFRRRVDELSIDISHFNGTYAKGCQYRTELPLDRVFAKGTSHGGGTLCRKILKNKLKEYKCVKCGIADEWNGEPITLQIDHENGDNRDNRLENLRFLCPNCHSQTNTFAGKRFRVHHHCSDCGESISKQADRCRKCSNKHIGPRPNKWPPIDWNKAVWEKPLSVLATELGGSPNGLKKHLARNGISYPPVGYWQRRQEGDTHEQALVKRPVPPKKRLMTDEQIANAHQAIKKGSSLRAEALTIGYHHTALGRAIKRLNLE